MATFNVGAAPPVVVVCSPDEASIELICEWLVEHGFAPLPAATGAAAARLCRYVRPTVLIVDLALPGGSGLDLLRGRTDAEIEYLSVLLLAGRDLDFKRLMREDPRLVVDDVLRKPFDLEEVGKRIEAILRRRHSRGDEVVKVGNLMLDPSRRMVRVGDRGVNLSRKEFLLLRVLISDPTRVFSREELLRAVWRTGGNTRTLDSHASRLRIKLDPDSKRFVVSVWGVGYKLIEPAPPAAGWICSADQKVDR
ncbi:MAG TPA: response regulator transcription factor [Solirubrobacterales bacterium]|jgi:DNA-binding response OmpR family regulator|nr:response regulator transcription factor [Solirubrobacterales bacterium]